LDTVAPNIFAFSVYKLLHITFLESKYEGWNFNNGNYLFTTDTK